MTNGKLFDSFQSLTAALDWVVGINLCASGSTVDAPTFEIITTPCHFQKRAFELINKIKPSTECGTQFDAGLIGKTRHPGRQA